MSIERWMDKEIVIRIYSWILLSRKKEHTCISANEVDKPRAYYAEWSKSEREKQILYIHAYIWNLEGWYWWSCLKGNTGDAGIENRPMDTGRGAWRGRDEWKESSGNIHMTLCRIWLRELKPGLCDNLEVWDVVGGGREVQEGGDFCIYMADSCWCMAETSTIL